MKTSKTSFTPGPWKVIKPGHGHDTEYRCVQIGKDEMYTTLEMLPADARLIALSPNLLEACEYAWNLIQHCDCHNGVLDGSETIDEGQVRSGRFLDELSELIFKAGGKRP